MLKSYKLPEVLNQEEDYEKYYDTPESALGAASN